MLKKKFHLFGTRLSHEFWGQMLYLRMRQLPIAVHGGNMGSSYIAGWYYRPKSIINSTLTPVTHQTTFAYTDLHHLCETSSLLKEEFSTMPPIAPPKSHTKLITVIAAMQLYCESFIFPMAAYYRFCHNGGCTEEIGEYSQYMLNVLPMWLFKMKMVPKIALGLKKYAVLSATLPLFIKTLTNFLRALDNHIQSLESSYILNTPHPTLVDVALGAMLQSHFMGQNWMAIEIAETMPQLHSYAQLFSLSRRMFEEQSPSSASVQCGDYDDIVPPSLSPALEIVSKWFEFLTDQCDAAKIYLLSKWFDLASVSRSDKKKGMVLDNSFTGQTIEFKIDGLPCCSYVHLQNIHLAQRMANSVIGTVADATERQQLRRKLFEGEVNAWRSVRGSGLPPLLCNLSEPLELGVLLKEGGDRTKSVQSVDEIVDKLKGQLLRMSLQSFHIERTSRTKCHVFPSSEFDLVDFPQRFDVF